MRARFEANDKLGEIIKFTFVRACFVSFSLSRFSNTIPPYIILVNTLAKNRVMKRGETETR